MGKRVLERFGGIVQMLGFGIVELEGNHELNALGANDGGHTHNHIIDAKKTGLIVGDGHDRFFIAYDRFADPLDRGCDSKIGSALLFDYLVGTVAYLLFDLGSLAFRIGEASQMEEVIDRYTGYVRTAPCSKLTVSVLSDNAGVNMVGIDLEHESEGIFQSSAIEHGA